MEPALQSQLQHLFRSTADIIQTAHDGMPDETSDQEVETALVELFKFLECHDDLAWYSVWAEDAPLERILSKTALRIISQHLICIHSPDRYKNLHQTLYNAMEQLGSLAYTKEGNGRFKGAMTLVQPLLSLLKPHSRIKGHFASVQGVRLGGVGYLKPYYSCDPEILKLAAGLYNIAAMPGRVKLDWIISDLTQLMCNLWRKRCGFIQGVPFGDTDVQPNHQGVRDSCASVLEEFTRFSRSRKVAGEHHARAYLYKMALLDEQLLSQMFDAGNAEFDAARNAILVCT